MIMLNGAAGAQPILSLDRRRMGFPATPVRAETPTAGAVRFYRNATKACLLFRSRRSGGARL